MPPRGEVKASCRLVPGQNPRKIAQLLKAAVKASNPDVQIQFESMAPAFQTSVEGPLPEALKRAVKFAFKRDAVFVRDGGTIGAMTSIKKCCGAQSCSWVSRYLSTVTMRRMRTSTGNRLQEAWWLSRNTLRRFPTCREGDEEELAADLRGSGRLESRVFQITNFFPPTCGLPPPCAKALPYRQAQNY